MTVALVLPLELKNDAVAPADWVVGAHVRLENDGLHRLGAAMRVEPSDDFEDVADAEEAVGVEELALVVGGEVGSQGAVWVALAPLVLAGCAGLGGGGGGGGARGGGGGGCGGG